ncbi:MAG: alpha/beta hydrolase [Aeromicrobium sp.]
MTESPTPDPDVSGIHVAEAGDGPLILCLHGIGSSSASFVAQRTAWAASYRVAAWDAPGYGRSTDPDRRLDLRSYARIAAALIAARGGRAHVIGMSWGGVIAMQLAVDHPDLIDRLVLGDSTRGSATSPDRARAMRARSVELAELGPRPFAEIRAGRLLRPAATESERRRVASDMAAAIRWPGYDSAAACMADTDMTRVLPRIVAPTLVAYGRHDVVTGRPEADALAAGLPHARVAVIDDAGHLANQENPARFNQVVGQFLSNGR